MDEQEEKTIFGGGITVTSVTNKRAMRIRLVLFFLLTFLVFPVTFIVAGYSLGISHKGPNVSFVEAELSRHITRDEYNELKSKVNVLDSLVENLTQQVLQPVESGRVMITAREYVELKKSISDLKKLLLDDPEATVTIPLIHKDISKLKDQDALLHEQLKDFKNVIWTLIGIIITLVAAMVGILIVSLARNSQKSE